MLNGMLGGKSHLVCFFVYLFVSLPLEITEECHIFVCLLMFLICLHTEENHLLMDRLVD